LPETQSTSDTLKPWQFFTIGALFCATAAVFIIRGTSPANVIFVCLTIFAAALVGLGTLRTLRPLVTGEVHEPEMVGNQTRVAIEREKNLVLRSIKELEFDHAMGKIAEGDYEQMVARLRSRAVRLLKQLDSAGSGYRELIERELASRLVKLGSARAEALDHQEEARAEALGHRKEEQRPESQQPAVEQRPGQSAVAQGFSPVGACATCGTANDLDARFCKHCGTKLLAILFAILTLSIVHSPISPMALVPAFAQFQMPDPKEMAGIPRPVTDLPEGHISVRLIRGQLSNNIQGHPVELHAGSKVTTVKTDENGRAEFSGIAAGISVKAVAIVDGERLESQEFPAPGQGGIRVMLVATPSGGGASSPAFQPQTGNVVFGDQTRVIIDWVDDALQVYYVLDIQNSARVPVNPPSALILDMPKGAAQTTVLAGAPKAVARGDRVTVAGPFAPGKTDVQVAYRYPLSDGEASISQTLPVPVGAVAVLTKKVGEMTLTSPQLPTHQEREFEGDRYVLAQGPPLAAGSTLTLNVSGLPHHSPVPRRIALTLAIVMFGAGFWAATRVPPPGVNAARVKQLTGRREKIFNDLIRLEQQRRSGSLDAARYAERRQALIAQLERVYRDLDAEGGQGRAA
jgi:hypothetical protein